MTQPRQTALPQFARGDVLRAASLQALSSTLGQMMSSSGSGTQQPLPLAVVLDEELESASDSMRGATSGLATVLRWDPSGGDDEEGGFEETDRQITVWNHSEQSVHAVDTFGVARWIENHWWFFGDCEPMADREGEQE